MDSTPPRSLHARLKPALDFGPLLVFFAVGLKWGILPATACLVPLSVIALGVSWRLEGKVSPLNLYGTIAVVVFGCVTLLLRDEAFIKIKLTVVYGLLGGVLGVGLLRGKAPVQALFGDSFKLTDEGWRRLTLRFTLFFLVLAGLNEVLRRVLSDNGWMAFKVFGVSGLIFLFTLLQVPLLAKHAPAEPEEG